MNDSRILAQLKAVWCRVKNQQALEEISKEQIKNWAVEKGLRVKSAEEREVGAFRSTPCIVLTLEEGDACFPRFKAGDDPAWIAASEAAEREAALWKKVEWFSSFWVNRQQINPLLKDVENCSQKRAVEMFDYHTSTIYSLAFQAVCIAQVIPGSHSLKEFSPLVREAFLAFYSGYRASSISALMPIVEGSLSRIVASYGSGLTIGAKIDRAIDRAIQTAARMHYGNVWVPDEFTKLNYLFAQDERVFVFETFRRWLHNSFFMNTGEYDGFTWLNRHLFAHGASADWQQSANFSRLILALATMGVVESWHDESNAVKLFFPDMNEDGTLLWEQGRFNIDAQILLKVMEEKRYHGSGRLVPELPTDDGVLLRAALLSEDCMKDLVRPLRDAGWSVAVSEPDEDAIFMRVVASCKGISFGVALLYSCATDNSIYRELAVESLAILYRGAPYKQAQYTQGVDVHVGPVLGWQPPVAPQ